MRELGGVEEPRHELDDISVGSVKTSDASWLTGPRSTRAGKDYSEREYMRFWL